MSEYLNKIVYLTKAQAHTLFDSGSITSGSTTIIYNPNDLYITPEEDPILYASTGGSASAITLAVPNFELITGAIVTAKITTTNSANATLDVNGSGAKSIKYDNANIAQDKLIVNRTYSFVYDGEYWQLIGDLDTNTDTKLQIDQINANNTPYHPIIGNGTTAAIRQYDEAFIYQAKSGTANELGNATLTLGNSTSSGTVGNKQGQLILYGSTAFKHTIVGEPTNNRILTLPDNSGTIALTQDIPDLANWTGSTELDTVGTVTTGTWNGSVIGPAYGGTGITSVGTGIMYGNNSAYSFISNPSSSTDKVLLSSGNQPTWSDNYLPKRWYDTNFNLDDLSTLSSSESKYYGGFGTYGISSTTEELSDTSKRLLRIEGRITPERNNEVIIKAYKPSYSNQSAHIIINGGNNTNDSPLGYISANVPFYLPERITVGKNSNSSLKDISVLSAAGTISLVSGGNDSGSYTQNLYGITKGTVDSNSSGNWDWVIQISSSGTTHFYGTADTANSVNNLNSSGGFYAPISAGTEQQALIGWDDSISSSVPMWKNIAPTINLTAGTSASAPTIGISVLDQNSSSIAITQGTTSVYGVVKLSDSINTNSSSTSNTLAASPYAVYLASRLVYSSSTANKFYLTGTLSSSDNTSGNVFDPKIYSTTTSGEISAVRYSFNNNNAEKAYITYNATDDSIDFIFN